MLFGAQTRYGDMTKPFNVVLGTSPAMMLQSAAIH
jgi:hypothetical protein